MKLNMPEMPPATLLAALGEYNLLPAIVFLPTRRRCDQAASEAIFAKREPDVARRERRQEFMREFVDAHQEVRNHRHWDIIVRGGVASHHAGHIPAWKLAIEKLMSQGLLDAIFATATVAAGVDFPARTVVLTGADARTGSGWRMLSASELQQMTGRAGRRSRDNVGFIVAAPGQHQDPLRLAQLLNAPADPLVSQFRATYTTLLNLLDAYGSFAHVREIAEKSFAHREAAREILRLETVRQHNEANIKARLDSAKCDLPVSAVLGLERLVSARDRLQESQPHTRAEQWRRWLNEQVRPGRMVGIGRSGKRLVLVKHVTDGKFSAIREDGRPGMFALERVGRVYAPIYQLREPFIEEAFAEIQERGRDLVLTEPRMRDVKADEESSLGVIDDAIEALVPGGLNELGKQRYRETLWATLEDATGLRKAGQQIESLRQAVWEPFEQRARVLAEFEYLDFEQERVTDRGRWLADLHIDRPLLVGEALEDGLFTSLNVPTITAIIAALTADEDRDYGELEMDDSLVRTLSQFEDVAFRVSSSEWKYGIEPAPEMNFSAAAAAARWGAGASWTTLIHETRAEEGDVFRMFSRTGEALLQIAGLRKAHPVAARTAATAAEIVLREPVR